MFDITINFVVCLVFRVDDQIITIAISNPLFIPI